MMLGNKSRVDHKDTGRVIASRNACRAFEKNDMLPRDLLLRHIAALQSGDTERCTVHVLPDGTKVCIATSPDQDSTEIRVLAGDN
jgi:hypothetical protein